MAEPKRDGLPGYSLRQGAWIHDNARIESGVVLEPGAVVGPGVHIGRDCWLGANAVIYRDTTLGRENRVYPGAVLGGDPQDLEYKGQPTRLEIGDRNVFREHVTISRGAPKGHGFTRIGNDNFFMASSHVGHDCVVADRCIFTNGVLIAGHCHIESNVNFAGGTAIVQFTTVGRFVYLGGLAGARHDLEPFLIHDCKAGDPPNRCSTVGVNEVGLRRGGVSGEAIRNLKTAFKVLFVRGVTNPDEALAEVDRRGAVCGEVEELIDFVRRKRTGRFGRQLQG